MNREPPACLANAPLVVHAFGRWPSFHDAHLISFARHGDVFECEIHGWNMTSEVDVRGYFRLERHHRVVFRFSGVFDADLDGLERCEKAFGTNILWGLEFTEDDSGGANGAFEVHLESVVDPSFCGRFRARRGEVVAVTPCDAEGDRNVPLPPLDG